MARKTCKWLGAVLLAMLAGAGGARAQAPAPSPAPASAAGLDLTRLSTEATGWLQGLIRINTTNPPGNELVAAKYLADILTKEGIPSEIFESTPGRGFLVARLQAGALPDPSRALLLMGHLDVVPVQKEKWSVDPFGGIIQGGYIYGRGAMDDKGYTITNVAILVALKRAGVRLNRDVILLAEGDEEAGGEQGMQFAVAKHWDKIACAFALNEGGEALVKDGKVQYVGVQTNEKVAVNVTVIATGTSGHASRPRKDNAVVHLAAAVGKIGVYQAPLQLISVTQVYFEQLAKVEDEETAKWMRALETSDRTEHAGRWLSDASPEWNAVLHDTITPTILQAGFGKNVIPAEARANLNIRLLPGNSIDALLEQLRKLVDDPAVRFEVQQPVGEATPSSSINTDLYQAIGKATTEMFPGAVVLPKLSTYATDSWPLRLRSITAYGLNPYPMSEDDLKRMHSEDERLSVDSFHKGVEFLYRIVSHFAVTQ
jgi:acetylornithine deacetylase/succinyl-diaminopimelate desuccinylase-like protein